MAQRTAMRLDDEAADNLAFLASIYGTRTDAMKHALAEVAGRERLMANMRALAAEEEAESGPFTEEELERARSYFR